MEKSFSFKNLQFVGFFVVSLLAFVFHFMYDWSGQNFFVGLFSAVNESVWEHTKIISMPFILFGLVEYLFLKYYFKVPQENLNQFIVGKTIAVYLMVFLLISFFYIYSGVLGYNVMAVDISSTFVYIAIGFIVSYKIYSSTIDFSKYNNLALILLFLLIIATMVFTVFPPHINLFMDSTTKTYGIN